MEKEDFQRLIIIIISKKKLIVSTIIPSTISKNTYLLGVLNTSMKGEIWVTGYPTQSKPGTIQTDSKYSNWHVWVIFYATLSSTAGMLTELCKHPADRNFCSVLLVGIPLTNTYAFPKGRTALVAQIRLPRRAMGFWTPRPDPFGRDAEGIAQPSQWCSLGQQVIHCDCTSQLLWWQTRSPPPVGVITAYQ